MTAVRLVKTGGSVEVSSLEVLGSCDVRGASTFAEAIAWVLMRFEGAGEVSFTSLSDEECEETSQVGR